MTRTFINFDRDEDQALKRIVAGQFKLPESPFTAADWSMKEAAPQANWEQEAESRISRSDVVIVLVGPKTHRASGVLKEVAIARKLGKKIVQVIGYEGTYPTSVLNAGRLIRWSWPNLKNVLRD